LYIHTHRSITFDSINNEITKMSRCYLERRIQRHDDLTQKHRKLTTIPQCCASDLNTTTGYFASLCGTLPPKRLPQRSKRKVTVAVKKADQMLNYRNYWVASAAAEALVASMNTAPAAHAAMPQDSSSETSAVVQKILNKAPETLPPGTQLKSNSTVIATIITPRTDKNIDEVIPLVASVSANDQEHSLVAESEVHQSVLTLLNKGSSTATFTITTPEGFSAELDTDGGIQLKILRETSSSHS